MNHLQYIPLILTGVVLNALAQLSLKQGASRISSVSFSMENIGNLILTIGLNPWIILGLFMYGISVLLWILALSRVDVSFAYPLLSVGYIIVAVAGWWLFDETLTLARIIGIGIIIIGVILISK